MGKEEFIQDVLDRAARHFPEVNETTLARLAENLWLGREINYAVGDEDLNTVAHRYFHGVGFVRFQLLMITPEMQVLPLEAVLILLAEHLFHYGFMCGLAEGRGVANVEDVAPLDEALTCLQQDGRPAILSTREELDQAASLPSLERLDELQDALPEGFEGTEEAPEDGERGYFG